MSDSSKPILVFVHGSWHSPEHFQPLFENLKAAGYECTGVSLPSNQDEGIPYSLTDDTLAVRATVEGQLAFNDVVVFAHSYGGVPTMNALEDLEKPRFRAHVGRETKVLAIGLMCAFWLPAGQSVLGMLGGKTSALHQLEGEFVTVGPPGPEYYFYNELPAEEAKHWASLLRRQANMAHWGETEYEAGLQIPVSYLLCTKDQAIPYEFQLGLVRQAESRGARVRTQVVETDHSPFLSQIETTAGFVRKTASGEGFE